MNWIGKILFILCVFTFALGAEIIDNNSLLPVNNLPEVVIVTPVAKDTKRHYHVRVLLQEAEADKPVHWKITANGFILIDTQAKTKTALSVKELDITCKKNFFFINNTPYDKKKFYITPAKGHLKFEGKEYQGSFLIVQTSQNMYLINSIDIEDYVFSVLRTESWPGWPLEVNKAFAIASRSYVIGVILNNRASTLPYHVKNTNKHQTYSGVHADPVLKQAVEQTRGIYLAFNNKPIIAMFDSCCGGVVPADIHGMNFSQAPYLARNYACTFCKDCKMFNWTARFSLPQFEQILKKEYKNIKQIKNAKVSKTDKAGLVQQVHIKAHNKLVAVPGKKIYSLVAKIRSFCFDIVTSATEIIINGKGIGHHMGLCQWGAREMVRKGYDHKAILCFYYPDTHFMRLKM